MGLCRKVLYFEDIHLQEGSSEPGGNAPVCHKSGPPRQTFPLQVVFNARDWKQFIQLLSLLIIESVCSLSVPTDSIIILSVATTPMHMSNNSLPMCQCGPTD